MQVQQRWKYVRSICKEAQMATSHRLRTLKQRFNSDSASWGSLLILVLGIATLVLLMVLYSRGWLMQPPLIAHSLNHS
jgi:hypothetical protein